MKLVVKEGDIQNHVVNKRFSLINTPLKWISFLRVNYDSSVIIICILLFLSTLGRLTAVTHTLFIPTTIFN